MGRGTHFGGPALHGTWQRKFRCSLPGPVDRMRAPLLPVQRGLGRPRLPRLRPGLCAASPFPRAFPRGSEFPCPVLEPSSPEIRRGAEGKRLPETSPRARRGRVLSSLSWETSPWASTRDRGVCVLWMYGRPLVPLQSHIQSPLREPGQCGPPAASTCPGPERSRGGSAGSRDGAGDFSDSRDIARLLPPPFSETRRCRVLEVSGSAADDKGKKERANERKEKHPPKPQPGAITHPEFP